MNVPNALSIARTSKICFDIGLFNSFKVSLLAFNLELGSGFDNPIKVYNKYIVCGDEL